MQLDRVLGLPGDVTIEELPQAPPPVQQQPQQLQQPWQDPGGGGDGADAMEE